MKFIRAALLAVFLVSCIAVSPGPRNGGVLQTSLGAPFHWDSRLFPIPVHVDDTLDPEIKMDVYRAIGWWNMTVGQSVFTYTEVDTCDLSFWEPGLYGVVGLTSQTLGVARSGHVILGEAELFLSSHSGPMTGNTTAALVHLSPLAVGERRYYVILHELGHVLGLEHDRSDTSLMFPTMDHILFELQAADLQYVRDQVSGRLDTRNP